MLATWIVGWGVSPRPPISSIAFVLLQAALERKPDELRNRALIIKGAVLSSADQLRRRIQVDMLLAVLTRVHRPSAMSRVLARQATMAGACLSGGGADCRKAEARHERRSNWRRNADPSTAAVSVRSPTVEPDPAFDCLCFRGSRHPAMLPKATLLFFLRGRYEWSAPFPQASCPAEDRAPRERRW